MSQGVNGVSPGTPIQRSFSGRSRSSPPPELGGSDLGQKLKQLEVSVELLKATSGKGQQVDARA